MLSRRRILRSAESGLLAPRIDFVGVESSGTEMRIDVPVTGRMVEAGCTETCPIAVERSTVEVGLLAWGGADAAGIMMGTMGMLEGCREVGRWVVVASTGGDSISWVG